VPKDSYAIQGDKGTESEPNMKGLWVPLPLDNEEAQQYVLIRPAYDKSRKPILAQKRTLSNT